MFDPVTIDTEINRLGRVAPSMDMIALKRSHAVATGTAFAGASTRACVAVAAYESAAARHERGRVKLAAVLTLGQHQAAPVTYSLSGLHCGPDGSARFPGATSPPAD
jgi:hypothetical protein